MKRFSVLLACVCCCVSVLGVPAQRVRRTVRLSDGSILPVVLLGDEHSSWLQADDGTIVVPLESQAGLFVKTDVTLEDAARHEAQRRETQAALAPKRLGSQATAPLPSIGKVRIPVVLVNFADSVFHVGATDEDIRTYYDLFCNGTRDGQLYRGHGSYGSVRDYFIDQSGGLFQPEFTIIGPIQLSEPESSYGSNRGDSKDTGYSSFRSEAIAAATEAYSGDWMDFDNRGKGQVDMVFYVYAGCGENSGAAETTIWPKESTASSTVGGIRFATTGCTSENTAQLALVGDEVVVVGARPDGIGVFCHELSHALGLPDFYDTSYVGFGMDLWSIMDYGCYAGGGYSPGAYTAYERDFMGWRQLETLSEAGYLKLEPTEAGGKGYKIVNDENPDEYYIIENRQPVGWDTTVGTMGCGLMVTHVDYQSSAWSANRVNVTSAHQRMTIIAANNTYMGTTASSNMSEWRETWSGNLYPWVVDGQTMNNSLTATSIPAATVFTSQGYMNKDLHAIRQLSNGSVSLYFGNDYDKVGVHDISLPAPTHSSEVYDLSGRRLPGIPQRAGLYIKAGRKHVVQ